MKLRKFSIAFLIVSFLCSSFLTAQEATLKTAYEDVAPKFMIDANGSVSGLCFDLMTLVSQDTEIKFSAANTYVPKKRFQSDLETGAIDVMFGMKKDAEREKMYLFGESLYSVEYVALALANDTAPVKTVDDILKLGGNTVVMTVFGAASVDYLKGLGLKVDDGSKDVESGISKLVQNRGRYFIYQNLSTMYMLQKSEYKSKVKVIPMDFEKYDHYVVFSKSADPKLVKKVNDSIVKLKKSGRWAKVTGKYL